MPVDGSVGCVGGYMVVDAVRCIDKVAGKADPDVGGGVGGGGVGGGLVGGVGGSVGGGVGMSAHT